MTNTKNTLESPFVFRNGMIIKCDNDDKNICISSYLRMAYSGKIDHVQLLIMDMLYEYGYATRHTITSVIKDTKDECKSVIHKLCNYGLIRKYHIEYKDSGSDFMRKTIDYYGLSGVGIQICKIKNKSGKLSLTKTMSNFFNSSSSDIDSAANILKLLAVNNFITHFLNDYDNMIQHKYSNLLIKHNNILIKQRAAYLMQPDIDKRQILIVPFAVRRTAGWINEIKIIIKLYSDFFNELVKQRFSLLYILIVEDNSMAIEANESLKKSNDLTGISYLYISDWLSNNDDVLDNLIYVHDNNDYNIVHLPIEPSLS